jgi:uncharacterized membrane protein YphA (DoxX/SURF4 family)
MTARQARNETMASRSEAASRSQPRETSGIAGNAAAVLARLFLGTMFLITDFFKIINPAGFQNQMVELLERWASGRGFHWYQEFLRSTVLPHARLFATLIMIAELYVAIALLLGVTTRLGIAVAMFLLVNYMLAKGSMPWNASSVDLADIALCLVVLVGRAGRTFGLDRSLHDRYPMVSLW